MTRSKHIQKVHKAVTKRIRSSGDRRKPAWKGAVIAAVIFGIVGVAMLFGARAATNFVGVEAESGTLTGGMITGDSSASAGQAVKFLANPAPLPIPSQIAPDFFGEIEFKVQCDINHYGPDDPIVYPNLPGKSHMHSFYDNPSTNAASTTESLVATSSSCINDMGKIDRSAYWVPSLYHKNTDGTLTQYTGYTQNVVYYRRPGGKNGPKIQPFPVGLRMIAGNAKATTATSPIWQVQWDCGQGGPEYQYIPTCSASAPLHASLVFPSCWDGVNLDSSDHKSHMAYVNPDGTCPASRPVSLPEITFEVDFPQNTGGPDWVLSSGGVYSWHGDFWNAWNTHAQNALVQVCLNNPTVDCGQTFYDNNHTIFQPGVFSVDYNNY